jgi:hypothetical protein
MPGRSAVEARGCSCTPEKRKKKKQLLHLDFSLISTPWAQYSAPPQVWQPSSSLCSPTKPSSTNLKRLDLSIFTIFTVTPRIRPLCAADPPFRLPPLQSPPRRPRDEGRQAARRRLAATASGRPATGPPPLLAAARSSVPLLVARRCLPGFYWAADSSSGKPLDASRKATTQQGSKHRCIHA